MIGGCGLLVPPVLGMGYDTINDILIGQLGLGLLLSILLVKILATTAGLGLGLPGGLIGPILLIGTSLGAAMGAFGQLLLPDEVSAPPLYALIGMGATLQAPLAALMAILELTNNSAILLPGMLAIGAASLMASEIFKMKSVFVMILEAKGLKHDQHPAAQLMRQRSIGNLMESSTLSVDAAELPNDIERIVDVLPKWVMIRNVSGSEFNWLISGEALVEAFKACQSPTIDIKALSDLALIVVPISFQASLEQAHEIFKDEKIDAVCVQRMTQSGEVLVYGICIREEFHRHGLQV